MSDRDPYSKYVVLAQASKIKNPTLSVGRLEMMRREAEAAFPSERAHAMIAEIFDECGKAPISPEAFKASLNMLGYHNKLEQFVQTLDPEKVFEGEPPKPLKITREQAEKSAIHDFIFEAFHEHLLLQYNQLDDFLATALGLKRFSPDHRGARVTIGKDGEDISDFLKTTSDERDGKGAFSHVKAVRYIEVYNAEDSRRGTEREIFSQYENAFYKLFFLESVAQDVGAREQWETAIAEIYAKKELALLRKPQEMIDFIYQRTLDKLPHLKQEEFCRTVNDHLKRAAAETGLAIPGQSPGK